VQDEVNQDYSEQNEVDGMKKGQDVNFIHVTKTPEGTGGYHKLLRTF